MISLSEVLVVLLVAVVVIKPEQLPEVAFNLGKWAKRLRSTMNNLRREFDGTVKQITDEPSSPPATAAPPVEPRHEAQQS